MPSAMPSGSPPSALLPTWVTSPARDDRFLQQAHAVDLTAQVVGQLALLLGAGGRQGRLQRREDEEHPVALRVAVDVEAQPADEEARQLDHLRGPARPDNLDAQ